MNNDKRHKHVIYKATNKINGKVYIGQTIEGAECRKNRHYRDKRQTTYFHSALVKYGKDGFIWEELCCALERDNLDELECYFIEYYNSKNREKGYNTDDGGKRRPDTFKHTEESKKKISQIQIGRKQSEESNKKRSETLKAQNIKRIISPEQRLKISNSLKGNIPWNKGRKETRPEVLERQSLSHLRGWNKLTKGFDKAS